MTSKFKDLVHNDDHARGCEGRTYTCTCGYDDRKDKALLEAAAMDKVELPGHNEGFHSVTNWCDETFQPSENERLTRFNRLLEEVVELGVAMGIPLQHMQNVVEISNKKCKLSDFDAPDKVPGESADVQITLWYLQDFLNIDGQHEMDKRMDRNRSRPKEYYAEKRRQKDAMGL